MIFGLQLVLQISTTESDSLGAVKELFRIIIASYGYTSRPVFSGPIGLEVMKKKILVSVGLLSLIVTSLQLIVEQVVVAQETQSVWDGVFSEEQARRGETAYGESCSECHGESLAGIDMAPGLAMGDFIWNYDGLPLATLFQRIRDTMPLGNARAVSRSDKVDILAFVMEQNTFPAGGEELPSRNSILSAITWLAVNPN